MEMHHSGFLPGWVIAKNSWGTGWGEGGFFNKASSQLSKGPSLSRMSIPRHLKFLNNILDHLTNGDTKVL
jgi:hypothetical protein